MSASLADQPARVDSMGRDWLTGMRHIGIVLFPDVEELDAVGPWEVLAHWVQTYPEDDLFVFLVHTERVIDDGNSGMMRGVFLWNSEVGAGSFKVRTFYLENVCGNHIVWGASGVREVRLRHRGDRILTADREMVAQLRDYADTPAGVDEGMIRRARLHVLGDDREKTIDRVGGIRSLGLTRKEIEGAYESAIRWEHAAKSPPTTAWGIVHGLTRLSQGERHADQRNRMDRAGGKILALATSGR